MAISLDTVDYPSSLFRAESIAVPLVARPRLLSRILGPDARKVTIVAAPTGYGKTVLLKQACDAFAQRGYRCLWLSINESVSDGTLLQLLWMGADRAGIASAAHAAVTANGLLNRFEGCAEPVAIIIDCLNQDMLKSADVSLWQLIHGTSQQTSFVIATETSVHLPMVRLEASGLLGKIGAAELAFDETDIVALGQVTTLPGWMSMLTGQLEGWPVLVQLALSRFRQEPDLAPPLLTGLQHDIAAFIEQDVLRSLDAPELACLLDASIVEQICGSLLDALSGSNDGTANLGKLMACGVPLRRVGKYGWFRLHPLLRDYLYDRLQRQDPDRLNLLHKRAANVLLSCGDEQAALRHATATGNIDFLRSIYQQLNMVQRLLPDQDEEWLCEGEQSGASSDKTSDPKWRTVFDLILSGQLAKARKSIALTRLSVPAIMDTNRSEPRAVEWEVTYSDLLMRVFDDRLPRPDQLEALRERLMRTPGVPPSIPAAVSELVIVSRFRRGELSAVAEADADLWHTGALAPPQSKIYVLLELGIAALELGELELACRHLNHARARALQAIGPHASQAYAASVLLAEVAFERGDRETSAQMLEQCFAKLKHEEIWFNLAASAFTTGSGVAAHRSWGDALQALEPPHSLSSNIGLWRLAPLLIAQRLRLACLWSEDLETARRDRATLNDLGLLDLGELDSAGFGWRVSVPAQLAVIRFDLADRKAEAARSRSLALRPILEARRHVRRLIELDLLQGRASIDMGDHAVGYALIRASLKSSVNSGMIQTFLDEARLLDGVISELLVANDISGEERRFLDRLTVKLARPSGRPIRYVANGRAFDLSSRESQLLRALATGKTFKEISFALNISVNTTKMHRTRLYRKLGCNCRSHAIALAQELIGN